MKSLNQKNFLPRKIPTMLWFLFLIVPQQSFSEDAEVVHPLPNPHGFKVDVVKNPPEGMMSLQSLEKGAEIDGWIYKRTADGKIVKYKDNSIPKLLSKTGIFVNTKDIPVGKLQPEPGIIEYKINLPSWSDNAVKRQWMAIAGQKTIHYSLDKPWEFPVGSTFIQHFEIETRPGDHSTLRKVETRVLWRMQGEWMGVTYMWREDESDAELVTEQIIADLGIYDAKGVLQSQKYLLHDSYDCLACHTEPAGTVLSMNTRQMSLSEDPNSENFFTQLFDTNNQLKKLAKQNYFDSSFTLSGAEAFPSITNNEATVEKRARAYLDVNCSNCHNPDYEYRRTDIDLRYATDLCAMKIVNAEPKFGSTSANGKIVTPGNPNESVLMERMLSTTDSRMPKTGSYLVDNMGVELIKKWISSLSTETCGR